MNDTKSLSFVVSLLIAAAIGVSMAMYGVLQYVRLPAVTVEELVFRHLWHTVLLGVLIYVLCSLVFKRILVRPLKEIYHHLYGVGAGRLDELDLDTNITELRFITDGINVMIRRMTQGADEDLVRKARERIAGIRELTKELSGADQRTAMAIMHQASRLEEILSAIVRGAAA